MNEKPIEFYMVTKNISPDDRRNISAHKTKEGAHRFIDDMVKDGHRAEDYNIEHWALAP